MGRKSDRMDYRAKLFLGGLAASFLINNRSQGSLRALLFLPVLLLPLLMLPQSIRALTLAGSFSAVPQGANINLTAEGKLDWVHWGLSNDTSLNRKATVIPQINDFFVLYDTNLTYAAAFRYADNYNGYSWFDGTQEAAVTNTITGVYVGAYSPQDTNGFEFTLPADTTPKTLKVYVGAFAARGRFQATLSGSSITYANTSMVNSGNGPGGVYTVEFAADSTNQTLRIVWAMANRRGANGNVTLQAATLTGAGANNPPFARLALPNMSLSAPANVTLLADAFDADGTISKVEFHNNGTKVGETASPPYSFETNNLSAGHYEFTARPLDNGGAMSVSHPIEIFVYTNGGTLNGSRAIPPSGVDLTVQGNLDWVHWGLTNATSVNRKAWVQTQISNFSKMGTNALERLTDSYAAWSWGDGTPTINTNSTSTGVFVSGITNGFQFSVPADRSLKTLKVYVGLYGGSGNFQAWLSDFSAPAFTDRSLSNAWNSSYVVYTLNYASASTGQSLDIRYRSDNLFDQDYGNVSLAAATLHGVAPFVMFNAQADSTNFTFRFHADVGRTYTIRYTEGSTPILWNTLTSIPGSGADETVTDSASHPHRFYRIDTE